MNAAVHFVHDPRPAPVSAYPTGGPAVRPAPHTMPSLRRLVAASIVLGLPSGAAIWGSATGLEAIAAEDLVASPWTLPFCLDVLALGVVIVAMMFPTHAGRLSWKATPWLCYLGSGVLQVAEAWDKGVRAWGTHAAGLVAAAVGSHFILDLWVTRATAAPQLTPVEDLPPATPVEPASDPGNVVALAAPTPSVARPRRQPRGAKRKHVAATELPDPDVVAKVEKALDEMGLTPADATRDGLLEHMRPGAPHARKVGAALRHLKERDR